MKLKCFSTNFYNLSNLKIFKNVVLDSSLTVLKSKYIFKKYFSYYLKNGKKTKLFNVLFKLFFDIYAVAKQLLTSFKSVNEARAYQLLFKENLNINIYLSWYTQQLNFVFFSSLWKPRKSKSRKKKKSLKKKKKTFKIKFFFLKKNNRNKIAFKFFFLKLLSLKNLQIKEKFLRLFLDLIFNYRYSWLYLFKINFYKKILLK